MMAQTVEFEKSAVKVWLLALLGVPFLLIGVDYFLEQKLIGRFGDLIYGAEELPAFEPRDTIIAALCIIVGSVLVVWGLKELVFPKKVFVADSEGIHLAVAGPFQPAILVPWDGFLAMEYEEIDDEGDAYPAVRIEFAQRSGLPDHPWGARWVGSAELLIDTSDWSPPTTGIVESLSQLRESADGEVKDDQ